MTKEILCIVSGRVQGVFFRDFVQRSAGGLHLVGTVRNLEDGTVEVVAVGEEGTLNKLLEKLKKGPILAKVETVRIEWRDKSKDFSDFKIVYKNFLDRL